MQGLKLKNFYDVTGSEIGHVGIMKEVFNFKKHWFLPIQRKHFYRYFSLAHNLAVEAQKVDISKLEPNSESWIKIPITIDNISFLAMMELQALFGNTDDSIMLETMAQAIAIVCYSENNTGKYDSSSFKFRSFRDRILNSNLFDMIGVYNWIDNAMSESMKMWEERFLSVQVQDRDYEEAGGHRMAQFNILITIKSICQDFNISYDEAWQQSYILTQTNSYAKATQSHIQDQMRILKEARMKKERKKQFG